MALQSFTWNNGTDESPVTLNAQQLANLVTLAGRDDVSKDVRGHITTSSGTISKYAKYVLNQSFPNLTVHATEQADSFALAASRTTINEGETSTIIVTGMATSSVDFAIEHTITGRNGIEENAIKSKIRMDGNTLVVDAPQENASWQDNVRIKAKPIYEEWSNTSAIRYVDVTVKAVALSGVTLVGASTIAVGNTEEISVNLIPSNCTKSSGVSFSSTLVSDGSLSVMQPIVGNGKIYVTAPAEECNLTLTTNVHLFGDETTIAFYATKQFAVRYPYIQFVVTTDGTFSDISSANPKITLQKVDSEDEPIGEPVVLTGTVSGSSLVYNYGNGNVAGDGSETYRVSIDNVQGYTTPNIADIVPNVVITNVSISYSVIQPDVYIVYTDGTEQQYDDFVLNGMQFLDNKTPNYIHVVDSRKEFGVAILDELITERFANTNISDLRNYGLDSIALEHSMGMSEKIAALFTHLDATRNNILLSSLFSNVDNIVKTCKEYSIVYEEETRNGYLPSSGEAAIIANNMQKIINIWNSNGVETTMSTDRIWSSTINESAGKLVLARFSGNAVTNIDLISASSTYAANVIPCFTL